MAIRRLPAHEAPSISTLTDEDDSRPAVYEAMCRNCDRACHIHRIAPLFCPQCGQPVVTKAPALRELARQFIEDNLSPRGTLARTLWLLVARPGRLTTLHWLGRRTHLLPPMKMYLGASFVFFLVLKFIAGGPNVPVVVGHINFGMRHGAEAAVPSNAVVLFTSRGALPTIVVTLENARVRRDPVMFREMDERAHACLQVGRDDCGWLDRMATRAAQRWAADPGLSQMAFVRHALEIAPYAVFLMLPVYATLVAIVWRRRELRFGNHLVFGLHLHAFWFLATALALLMPRAVVAAIAVFAVWHVLRSMREAYGGSWHGIALRGIAISIAYAVVFVVVTVATSFCLFVS